MSQGKAIPDRICAMTALGKRSFTTLDMLLLTDLPENFSGIALQVLNEN